MHTKPRPLFRTALVESIACGLCPSRAYSGVLPAPACKGATSEAAFRGRGWKLYTHPTWGTLQVCARCARNLGPQWQPVAHKEDARA